MFASVCVLLAFIKLSDSVPTIYLSVASINKPPKVMIGVRQAK